MRLRLRNERANPPLQQFWTIPIRRDETEVTNSLALDDRRRLDRIRLAAIRTGKKCADSAEVRKRSGTSSGELFCVYSVARQDGQGQNYSDCSRSQNSPRRNLGTCSSPVIARRESAREEASRQTPCPVGAHDEGLESQRTGKPHVPCPDPATEKKTRMAM